MPAINQHKSGIEQAAANAVKVIADAADNATRVIASAASEAAKVSNAKGADDHDLLVTLNVLMTELKKDVKEIRDGAQKEISEHETRIRALEGKVAKYFITITLYSIAVAGLAWLIINHLNKIPQ